MREVGVDCIHSVEHLGVTGFTEVIVKIWSILRIMTQVAKRARLSKTDAAILIDYPDFNLRLAKRLKKLRIPVIYYVSPQMWAWRASRVKAVRKTVNRMMVLFPFEEKWYLDRGVDASFVGHPVIDRIINVDDRMTTRDNLGISPSETVIALLPGSRMNEVAQILPTLLRACRELTKSSSQFNIQGKRYRFLLPIAETISEHKLQQFLPSNGPPIEIIHKMTLQVLRAADFAWVTSGTAALETALLGTPHIVVYRMSNLTYKLARILVQIPWISIANLMLGTQLIPELVQDDFSVENLLEQTSGILHDPIRYSEICDQLSLLRGQFGHGGASDRAARVFLETIRPEECSGDA